MSIHDAYTGIRLIYFIPLRYYIICIKVLIRLTNENEPNIIMLFFVVCFFVKLKSEIKPKNKVKYQRKSIWFYNVNFNIV